MSSTRFNPFPGLRPFRMDEKYLFFGREQQTQELLQRLSDHRFLAVVGTSGSGKSSLVQAGLLPHLYGGTMLEAGFNWEVAVMRPGGDPLTHLAEALVESNLYDPDRVASVLETRATLRRSGQGLVEAIRQSDIAEGTNLLIVVDQFEEIFRFRRSGPAHLAEAGAFVKLLLNASQQSEIPIYVALTMRSDYLGDCSEFARLAEAVNEGEYLIPRLSRKQRRQAIVGPVKVGGGELSPRLLQTLLNDVGDNPDHLPVLQHALMRTWEEWEQDQTENGTLDLRHYEAVGGMSEALSRHADEVFKELPDDHHRDVAEKMFKALTERSLDNRGIRRPASLGGLCAVTEAKEEILVPIIEEFRKRGRTFLMPGEEVEVHAETVIDISHESLMRVWRRLDGWVEEESQSSRIYGRLQETAELHADGKAGLYHDPDLQIAQSWREESQPNGSWAEQYGGAFDATMAFLEESERAARQSEREAEANRQRELAQAKELATVQQRAARGFRRFAVGMALVAIAAVIAFGFALHANREADRLKDEAVAERENAERQKYASNLLAAEALMEEPEGVQEALLALEDCPEEYRQWEWHRLRLQADQTAGGIGGLDPLRWADYSPDGRFLLTRERGGVFKVWDATGLYDPRQALPEGELYKMWDAKSRERSPLHKPLDLGIPKTEYIIDPQFHPDKERLYIVSGEGVHVWNFVSDDHETLLGPPPKGIHVGEERVIGLTDATGDGFMTIWDYTAGREWCRLQQQPLELRKAAFSPDGQRLATLHKYEKGGCALWVWETHSGAGEHVESRAWIPDLVFRTQAVRGAEELETWKWRLLVAGGGGTEWDLSVSPPKIITRRDFTGLKDYCASLTRHPSGDAIAVAGVYGVTIEGRGHNQVRLFGHRSMVRTVRFHPSGDHFVSAGDDGTVRFWETETARTLGAQYSLQGHSSPPQNVDFNADGSWLASCGGEDGTLRVWDPITGQEQITLRHDGPVTHAAFHPVNRSQIASIGGESARVVKLWDLSKPEPVARFLEGPDMDMKWVAFSPDGEHLAAAGEDPKLYIWNAHTGELEASFPVKGEEHVVNGLAYSPDGTKLATCYDDVSGVVKVWDSSTGSPVEVFDGEAPRGTFQGVAYSPDGSKLAVASDNNEILVWDVASRSLDRFQGHQEAVLAFSFSPNGDRLFSASQDKTLRVWDVTIGKKLIKQYPLKRWPLRGLAVNPAGTTLAGATQRTHRVMLLETKRPVAGLWRQRETVRAASEAVALQRVKGILRESEVVDSLLSESLTDDARKLAIEIARIQGDDVWGLLMRSSIDSEIAQAQASGAADAVLAELHYQRFTPEETWREGLTPAAIEDWGFLRDQPRAVTELLPRWDNPADPYFWRLGYEAVKLLEKGQLEEAVAAGRTWFVYHAIRSVEMGIPPRRDIEPLANLDGSGNPLQALINPGKKTKWRYLDTGAEPGPNWTAPEFDYSGWREKPGPAPLGFGDEEESYGTKISKLNANRDPIITFYFRHEFDLTEAQIQSLKGTQALTARLRRDDGAVLYLNGQEIARDNMPTGEIQSDTRAIDPVNTDEGVVFDHPVPSAILKPGKNVLAAEVHQIGPQSTDVVFDLSLIEGSTGATYLGELTSEEILAEIAKISDILPVSQRERWSERARFAIATKDADLVESPLANDADAWLLRSRLQKRRLDFDRALQAVDKSLTLLEEDGRDREAAVALRDEIQSFITRSRP